MAVQSAAGPLAGPLAPLGRSMRSLGGPVLRAVDVTSFSVLQEAKASQPRNRPARALRLVEDRLSVPSTTVQWIWGLGMPHQMRVTAPGSGGGPVYRPHVRRIDVCQLTLLNYKGSVSC